MSPLWDFCVTIAGPRIASLKESQSGDKSPALQVPTLELFEKAIRSAKALLTLFHCFDYFC